MKSLLVLYSYHHKNTEKVAKIIASVLDADIKSPQDMSVDTIKNYDLIGFGSGIYSEQHHPYIFELVERLPHVLNKSAFIFSTSAIINPEKCSKDHLRLREKLNSKGYVIIGEFSCKGFNTNSFLKYFGGMNKGRPNDDDLEKAEFFARNIKNQQSSDCIFAF